MNTAMHLAASVLKSLKRVIKFSKTRLSGFSGLKEFGGNGIGYVSEVITFPLYWIQMFAELIDASMSLRTLDKSQLKLNKQTNKQIKY